MEWLSYLDRGEARATPLPRSPAHLKPEITEKKRVEARQWAGGRTSKKKDTVPKSRRPDGAVVGSAKRLDSRCYRAKTGHCLAGQYPHWTKNRPTPPVLVAPVSDSDPGPPLQERKLRQEILWAEVFRETGRWKSRWKVRDLVADGRCSRAVLDFLSTTEAGRRVPVEDDAEREGSEWELRERQEREEDREAEAAELGPGEEELPLFYLCPPSWHPQTRLGGGPRVLLFLSFVSHSRSDFSFPL